MRFPEKLKEFFASKGLTRKRDIAKAMDTNEQVVGRWMKSDKPTALLLERLEKFFPDAPLAYLLAKDVVTKGVVTKDIVNESGESYNTEAVQLVVEIEEKLSRLKEILAQNCHNK